MTRTFILTTALGALIATPALAKDITLQDFVGQVSIIEGSDGVRVLDAGTKGGLDYSDGASGIVIDGGLDSRERSRACNGGGLSFDLDWGNRKSRGDTRLDDYPKLEISVPAGTDLTIRRSSVLLDSDVALGQADLEVAGCFDIDLADVDEIDLDKTGSGDFSADDVDIVTIETSGAGDVDLGSIGHFELEQSGSGEIEIERIRRHAEIDKSGSGDVEVDRLDGVLRIDKSGSGDIDVKDGEISDLRVENSGSGDIDIDADVGDAYIRASGSGDIHVRSISGVLDEETSGSADFTRGDD